MKIKLEKIAHARSGDKGDTVAIRVSVSDGTDSSAPTTSSCPPCATTWRTSARGRRYMLATLSDPSGQFEASIFDDQVAEQVEERLMEDGFQDQKYGLTSVRCDGALSEEPGNPPKARMSHIRVSWGTKNQVLSACFLRGVRWFVIKLNEGDTCGEIPNLAVSASGNDQELRKREAEALQRATERYALLSETAALLLKATAPQAVVEEVGARVMRHLNCDVFFNYLLDEEQGRLRLNACAGVSPEEAKRIEWLDCGAAVCGCVACDARTGREPRRAGT